MLTSDTFNLCCWSEFIPTGVSNPDR